MKRTLLTLAALAVFAVAASPTWADDQDSKGAGKGKRDPAAMFKKMDTNGDSKVSKEEFTKFMEQAREKAKSAGKGAGKGGNGEKVFSRLDTNGDGFLSLDEYKKMAEMRKKKDK